MIDFHCHLDLYPKPVLMADEIQRMGFGVLSVTTTPSAWVGTSRLAEGRSAIRTALGLHPQLALERSHELKTFDRHFADARFIGEVGLDGSPQLKASWEDQTKVFGYVLGACNEAGDKIVSIHSRRAASQVLDFLDKFENVRLPVLHWFSGGARDLKRAIARGCWFSVGPAMLAGAKGRALVSLMPTNRVLLETDGPFAQIDGVALRPSDISTACESLSGLWRLDCDATNSIIHANERSLLAVKRIRDVQ